LCPTDYYVRRLLNVKPLCPTDYIVRIVLSVKDESGFSLSQIAGKTRSHLKETNKLINQYEFNA
jgi:hypothetical protein